MMNLKEKKMLLKMKTALGESVDQLRAEIAAEEAKAAAESESRRSAFEGIFAGLAKNLNELAVQDKKRTIEQQTLVEQLGNLFNKIATDPQVPQEIREELAKQDDPVEDIVPDVVPVIEQPQPTQPQKPATVVDKVVSHVAETAQPTTVFVQPNPPLVDKDIKAIQNKLKLLEGWISKISMNGPGGGAIWLRDLEDVSRTIKDATDGQVLTYNAITNKWVAATPTPGGAVSNTAQLYAYVTNDENTTIHKGDPVYLYRATGNRPSVKLAYNIGDAYSAKTMGLAAENIGAGNPGWIMVRGVLTGVDTSTYAEGDTLYLGSTAGTLTNVKPYAPNHLVYIGVVVKANQGQGQIYIQPQNGYELDEIHNVNIDHNVALANGHTIVYNSSNSLWENRSLSGLVATYTANSANYIDGIAAANVVTNTSLSNNLANYQTTAGLSANVSTLTANNTAYLGGIAANEYAYANISSLTKGSDTLSLNGANKVELPGGTSYIFSATNNITIAPDNTGSNYLEIINNVGATLSTDRAFEIRTNTDGTDKTWTFTQGGNLFFPDSTYQTTAWTGSVATLTANNTNFVGSIAAANVVSNSQLSSNLANYQTTAGLSANVATLTANNTSFVGSVSAANVVSNTQLSSNLANYQTTAGLSANVATLTANNASYLGGVAAASYAVLAANANFANVTVAGTVNANAATAFIAGIAANSGVALQMPHEGALRNLSTTPSTMYFDVNNGGSAHGYFNFRSSNNFTSIVHLGVSQVTFNSGAAITGQTPYVGRTSFNVALDTVVTVDNIKYRISNQGGIFPQIASASGSTVDVCYDVLGIVSGTTNPTYANNSGYILLADGTWLSIYSSHGLDTRSDRLTAHITDKAAGKIYRVTFMVTNNNSNTTGYNIIVERIM